MSKADSSPSTAAPTSKSRRAVILGAGGIAAAGALLTLPAAAGTPAFNLSPEILEYRRRKAVWNACFVGDPAEDKAWEAAVANTGDAVEDAIETVLARPCRSWQDVVELAGVVRDELWDTEDPDNWYVHSHHGDLEPAHMKAIFAVAGGGANA